jgi:FkbM family methyltransferase
MNAMLQLAGLARQLTGSFTFRKRLPAAFGRARIRVTARSDVRLLVPGFARSAADLFTVAGSYVRPGDCVWDIGSNLGIFSFCAAWKAGPQGKVFSLEADPYYVELQHKTARTLACDYAPVIPLCVAVADGISILELAIPKRGHSRNHLRIVAGNDAGETQTIKHVVTITGDFLLEHWPKPDFVKVDIEGAELLFLSGAGKLLATARPSFYIEVGEAERDKITNLFRVQNYALFELSANGEEKSVERCAFNTLAKPAEKC